MVGDILVPKYLCNRVRRPFGSQIPLCFRLAAVKLVSRMIDLQATLLMPSQDKSLMNVRWMLDASGKTYVIHIHSKQGYISASPILSEPRFFLRGGGCYKEIMS